MDTIRDDLQIWPETLQLNFEDAVMYFSKQGNWHVTQLICEGYRKIIYDGQDFGLALEFLLGLHSDHLPIIEVPAEASSTSA